MDGTNRLIIKLRKFFYLIILSGLRKWIKSQTNLNQKKKIIEHLKKKRKHYFFGISGFGAGSYGYYVSHLELTPITHRKRFILFNSNQLKEVEQLERQSILELYKDKILLKDNKYTIHAQKIANRLFSANLNLPEVNEIKWKLTVIEADVINACAFPVC